MLISTWIRHRPDPIPLPSLLLGRKYFGRFEKSSIFTRSMASRQHNGWKASYDFWTLCLALFNSSSYRERIGLRAVWGLPHPDSGRTPVVCSLLVLCTGWHGGRRRQNLIGRAASGMLRALLAESRRVKVDHASTVVCGGRRGRICGLLCGLTGAWNGGSWQCVVLIGSSPIVLELCSRKLPIDWERLDAGQHLLGWTLYYVIKM